MDTLEAIKARRSYRSYIDKPVPNEILMKVLEAATYAPSASNFQPWRFIIVKSSEKKKELAQTVRVRSNQHIARAPILIVVLMDPMEKHAERYGERGTALYCIQDCAAAIENILLAATSLGLGTCWVGGYDDDAVRKALNIPNRYKPVAIIDIGYPTITLPPRTARKTVPEVTYYENFGRTLDTMS